MKEEDKREINKGKKRYENRKDGFGEMKRERKNMIRRQGDKEREKEVKESDRERENRESKK